ncbi:sensor histidine kinase [Chloroflexota bacterium]
MTNAEQPAKQEKTFLDDFAHEIKTPLTSIIASWSLLAEELSQQSDGPVPRLVRNIGRSAIVMRIRIDELLDTAMMRSAELTLNKTDLNLVTLINRCTTQFRIVAEGKGQHIKINLPPDLPRLRADGRRIEQVLFAFLESASKNAPVEGTIEVNARINNDSITIEVHDTGPAMPQRQTDGKNYSGLNMGFALAYHLVELHSGKVRIESGEGKGNTIAFSLPLS